MAIEWKVGVSFLRMKASFRTDSDLFYNVFETNKDTTSVSWLPAVHNVSGLKIFINSYIYNL